MSRRSGLIRFLILIKLIIMAISNIISLCFFGQPFDIYNFFYMHFLSSFFFYIYIYFLFVWDGHYTTMVDRSENEPYF